MIKIEFVGPFSVADLKNENILRKSGIYFWAVKMASGKYRISYVGETTRSFFMRAKEHIIQTLGGNYRICDAEAMLEGREVIVWEGMWRSGTRDRIPELMVNAEAIMSAALAHLSVKSLFVANMEGESHLLRRVEFGLVSALRKSPDACSLLPDDIRYRLPQYEGPPIFVNIKSSVVFEGLPNKLEC